MIFVILSAVYCVMLCCFVGGLRRGLKKPKHSSVAIHPPVSVLVCARNEERHIGACLESIATLSYPADKIQVVVVDDHSDDRTGAILDRWQERLPQLHIVNLRGRESLLHGKVNALIHGFDECTGEFVFVTDADCRVSPDWIEQYLAEYDDTTGMVSSITIQDSMKPASIVQSIEMMQLLGMSMAAINLGIAVSVIGNNLSIRKAAYDEIGGYRSIPFSVTEDIALFQTMWHSRWDVRFKAGSGLLVTTEPPATFGAWWRQKQRWVVGAKAIGFMGWFILLLGYLGFVAAIGAWFSLPVVLALATVVLKCLGDLVIVLPVMKSLRAMRYLAFFPLYQCYLLFFLLCVPIQYLQKTVVWKGRDYRT